MLIVIITTYKQYQILKQVKHDNDKARHTFMKQKIRIKKRLLLR